MVFLYIEQAHFSPTVNLSQSTFLPMRDGLVLPELELQDGKLWYLFSSWGRRSSTIHAPGKQAERGLAV